MGNFNKAILLGNITRDPELRVLPSDTKVVDFGLATSRRYRTNTGEEREETLFIDCAAFGRQAEVLHEYCQKGRPLFVEGRLKYDTWEDRQTGQKRSKISLVVENFQFVGPRDGGPPLTREQREQRELQRDPKHAAPEQRRTPAGKTHERNAPGERKEELFEESDFNHEIPF